MSASSFQLHAAERLYREARFDEALAAFEACLAADPRLAFARSFRGLILCHRGDFDAGLADLREAVAIAPRDPALHTNLGMILFVADRLDEAQAALRRALTIQPNHPEAAANLSLVLRARGDFGGAERAARVALAVRPDFAEARVNLGYALLAQGKFAEGWAAISFRPNTLVNLRDPGMPVTVVHHDRLPPPGTPIIVHAEQGLGDTLFFLRFVPQLRARGYRLAFWGDRRLHSLLARTGHFEHLMAPEAVPGPGLALLWAGELPFLLGANDAAAFPAPLPVPADPARLESMRGRLSTYGPPPYVALTWRAGLPRSGQVVLSKSVPPEVLGRSLAGMGATLVSLQRAPVPEEHAALAAAAQATVHDASDVNADLESALALVTLLDDYVGVSNTNTHLRAAAGKAGRVLVPWPPEWRWLETGRSPWFASIATYRQGRDGDWGAAVAQLRADLAARA